MKKEIASQVVLEEEGAQKKDMMLRAPEAVPEKCALPPDTHMKTQEEGEKSNRTR